MKNKMRNIFLASALCAGIFLLPAKAQAKEEAGTNVSADMQAYADTNTDINAAGKGEEDTEPPFISAVRLGEMLHIEASDKGLGVDAVFVNGGRINYRVDNAVDVPIGDYVDSSEAKVEVYAVDFAGNRSEAVEIANPYYEGNALSASASGGPEEEADTESRAFTPNGQASVLDTATGEDGKEFYVFSTPEDNIFYLVVDRQRDSDNVYFLNAVTEADLAALAEKESTGSEGLIQEAVSCLCPEKCEAGYVNTACPVCRNTLYDCLGKQREDPEPEEEKAGKGSGGAFFFILLAAAAAGGAGYYLKIYRPKRELDDAEDLDELLGGDSAEINEDGEGCSGINVREAETDAGQLEKAFYEDYLAGYDGIDEQEE